MKKYILIYLVAVICTFGCKKDKDYDYPTFSLIGDWKSNDSPVILNIKNTKNEGDLPKYLDHIDGDIRKLQVTDAFGVKDYEIKWLGKNELYLIDPSTKGQIPFFRY